MQYKVTTQIDGKDVLAETLYQNVRYGQETASFSYDSSYLENPKAFSLAPDMSLGSGAFHSEGLKEFRARKIVCLTDGEEIYCSVRKEAEHTEKWQERYKAGDLKLTNREYRKHR